ncbi:MAG: TetR/AcrR family transcriptional regulator [Nevskiales bacterium]|nr:TetR/AcrR family transcriptional regulator [Nevskiales bacterium]
MARTSRRSPESAAAPAARVGRPRRSADQASEMRRRVIEAARCLFAEHGFEAVSMRRIAAASGCAPMTLYGYFRSKNEILRYIWEAFFDEVFERVNRAVAASASPVGRLRSASATYLGYWIEHPDRYRMVYLNQDEAADGEGYYVDASPVLERFEIFRELIVAAQAEGRAWSGDVQVLAETLICGLHGIAHSRVTIPEYPWGPLERQLEQMLRVVLLPDPN